VASFRYIAVSTAGARVQGEIAAPNEQAVLAELEVRQLTPVKVEARAERAAMGSKVPVRHLAEAYGQVADLLRAGVPLMRALKLLANLKSRPNVARAFAKLAESVEKGSDLAAAMEEQQGVFATVHVAMVRAGERGGFLDQVMARLARLVTAQADLRAKVVGNMIYPGVLATVGTLVGVMIFVFMVPPFRDQLTALKGGLPTITRVVFGVSDLLTSLWWVTVLVAVAAVLAWWRLSKVEAAKEWIAARLPRMPVVGALLRAVVAARVCGLMGSMLANGVPLLSALAIAREGAGSRPMANALADAMERVRQGQGLSQPLAASGMLDPDVVEMIAVGEGANNLDEVFDRVAETLEARVDRLLTIAVRLIEPLMLVLIASVVGVVAVALILPMVQMSSRL
jgi:general secretion pathway protein F/type IV pilus assembly protein PilC